MKRLKVWSIPRVVPFLAIFLALALITSGVFAAAAHINLGNAEKFAVLAYSGITNVGATTITGDAGSSPTSTEPGFASVTFISGTNHTTADTDTQNAKTALAAAYINAAGQGSTTPISADLGTMSPLIPGVYNSASSIGLTGTLTLDGKGDPNAVFVFQAGSSLITASSSKVVLTNGAQACNVYWQVGSSATLGTTSSFVGNILAYASITDDGGSTVNGRFLAETGAVTLNNTTISRPFCDPTISKSFSLASIPAGGTSTLTITLSNINATSATLNSSFTDNLPSGVEIAGTPNLSTTCGGSPTSTTGSLTLPAAGSSIPGGGNCTIKVDVTAPDVGVYVNTIPSGALVTSEGSNTSSTSATLTSTSTANATTSIGTTLSATSITVGGAVHDSASLSGASIGTVTYFAYTDNVCTLNGQNAGSVAVSAGGVPDSNSITFNTAGTYYWQAVYSGVTGFNPSTSICNEEVLTVNKASPTITTALSSSAVTTGSTVYDNGTLVGAASGAIGTVTYTIYTNDTCTVNAQTAGIKTVTSGVIQTSNPVTFNAAGTYYWQAVYTGDNNNNGATSTCGSEVLTVTQRIPVTGGTSASAVDATSVLPKSGFAPLRKTILSVQSADKAYSNLGDLWLEIPHLNVNLPIVGVPRQENGEWDVSWLGNQVGWLNGTAYPTMSGNSVLTGHVVDVNGNPGPFVGLFGLSWGDKVIVHAWGSQYIYEVRQVAEVDSGAVYSVLKHEDSPYITLVTCRGYDEASNSYKYRVLVRAVLEEVK
jgi:LPXTG-site transpeptidase (sortase) family protein